MPVPPLSPLDGSGCPTDTYPSYWRGQLRYAQLSEVMRFAAVASATYAVVKSSRPTRKRSRPARLATVVIVALLTLVGLSPLAQVADEPGLLVAASPGVLSLLMVVALTVTALRRVGGRSDHAGVLLAVSAVTMLLSALIAVEALADVERQATIPDNAIGEALRVCSFGIQVPPAPLPGLAVLWAGGAVLLFAAPALFVWSVLNLGAPLPPTAEHETAG